MVTGNTKKCVLLKVFPVPSRLKPKQLRACLLLPNLFEVSLFTPSNQVQFYLEFFFTTSSRPCFGTYYCLKFGQSDAYSTVWTQIFLKNIQ